MGNTQKHSGNDRLQKSSKDRATFTVVGLQVIVCILCATGTLLSRYALPSVFQWLRSEYMLIFAEENEEPLLRFVQALLDGVSIPVDAAEIPQRCSPETYRPQQEYCLPLREFYVSSAYGWRVHPISGKKSFHNGVDLAAPEGSAIGAVMCGIVLQTGYDDSNGNYLILRHEDGVETVYCHMQFVFVRAGEVVQMGQLLGTVGQTGAATGPHLHLCLKQNGMRYDPAELLESAAATGSAA